MKKVLPFFIFLMLLTTFNRVFGQAPLISYPGTHNYMAGIAITTITPLNGGGAVPGVLYGQTTTFATGNSYSGLVMDAAGNLYFCDINNNLIRKISPSGIVTRFAGDGTAGFANGTSTAASFNSPQGLAIDAAGNLYVADHGNNLIREINPYGVVTTFAGSGSPGSNNATGTMASFNGPAGLAVDVAGNVYVSDQGNQLIRKITPTGQVSTLAGTAAGFNNPAGLAVDGSGNVYVADQANDLIRMVTPAGVVTTVAGMAGISGSMNGTGTAASFYAPAGLVLDAIGNIYVTDANNALIRKITPAGVVTTLAGGGAGQSNGTGTAASFVNPNFGSG